MKLFCSQGGRPDVLLAGGTKPQGARSIGGSHAGWRDHIQGTIALPPRRWSFDKRRCLGSAFHLLGRCERHRGSRNLLRWGVRWPPSLLLSARWPPSLLHPGPATTDALGGPARGRDLGLRRPDSCRPQQSSLGVACGPSPGRWASGWLLCGAASYHCRRASRSGALASLERARQNRQLGRFGQASGKGD